MREPKFFYEFDAEGSRYCSPIPKELRASVADERGCLPLRSGH